MSEPLRPLASVLSRWRPGSEHPTDELGVLSHAWPAIVGADVAANTRPAELSGDTLLVHTRSSAWSQQLSLLSERVRRAVCDHTGIAIEQLRFRVGRLREQSAAAGAGRAHPRRAHVRGGERGPAPTLEAAIERFRASVAEQQRAKRAAGWKECRRCGARTFSAPGLLCVPCSNLQVQERTARVARLLFEAPWLGYDGVSRLVPEIGRTEYDGIRLQLLRRWKDTLDRFARSPRPRVTARERSIASSYVLLKSGLEPDRISRAVVRDLLGEPLHELLYGTENS